MGDWIKQRSRYVRASIVVFGSLLGSAVVYWGLALLVSLPGSRLLPASNLLSDMGVVILMGGVVFIPFLAVFTCLLYKLDKYLLSSGGGEAEGD